MKDVAYLHLLDYNSQIQSIQFQMDPDLYNMMGASPTTIFKVLSVYEDFEAKSIIQDMIYDFRDSNNNTISIDDLLDEFETSLIIEGNVAASLSTNLAAFQAFDNRNRRENLLETTENELQTDIDISKMTSILSTSIGIYALGEDAFGNLKLGNYYQDAYTAEELVSGMHASSVGIANSGGTVATSFFGPAVDSVVHDY